MDYAITICALVLIFTKLSSSRGPPQLMTEVQTYQVFKEGDTVKLDCPVEGGDPMFEWTKDGSSINKGWERFKQTSAGLRIKESVTDDSGRYVCHAANGFGSLDVEYILYVASNNSDTDALSSIVDKNSVKLERPYFIRSEQMQERHVVQPVGSSVKLSCKAGGTPKPSVLWFKDGKVTVSDTIQTDQWIIDPEFNYDEEGNVLYLTDLQEADSGSYTCKVFNSMGSINFTYILEIVGLLSKPVISDPYPGNTTVKYGDSASFQCTVYSQVKPTIQWLKRVEDHGLLPGVNSTFKLKDQQFVVLDNGKVLKKRDGSYLNKLTIEFAKIQDAGMYVCFGVNSMGYSFRSAHLTVLQDHHVPDSSNNFSLALIISVPALIVIALILAVLIIRLKRNRNSASNNRSNSHNHHNHQHPHLMNCQEASYLQQAPCTDHSSCMKQPHSNSDGCSETSNKKSSAPSTGPSYQQMAAYHQMNANGAIPQVIPPGLSYQPMPPGMGHGLPYQHNPPGFNQGYQQMTPVHHPNYLMQHTQYNPC